MDLFACLPIDRAFPLIRGSDAIFMSGDAKVDLAFGAINALCLIALGHFMILFLCLFLLGLFCGFVFSVFDCMVKHHNETDIYCFLGVSSEACV